MPSCVQEELKRLRGRCLLADDFYVLNRPQAGSYKRPSFVHLNAT